MYIVHDVPILDGNRIYTAVKMIIMTVLVLHTTRFALNFAQEILHDTFWTIYIVYAEWHEYYDITKKSWDTVPFKKKLGFLSIYEAKYGRFKLQ